eukprot:gnl/TRDRNA2_/TRDRNA2_90494_c0_seq2.p1 gnl/TRDRNA2_/TRDRNA2_90494_c0~~gnl/TRDRNA2_/TRDRNA2_90494_c0_seq2.p1  ORF type:complete len:464 (+),score=55.68 gnl/TRDRNA2_/TRDRNA2_90494_c0_seq2:72-1463(+)
MPSLMRTRVTSQKQQLQCSDNFSSCIPGSRFSAKPSDSSVSSSLSTACSLQSPAGWLRRRLSGVTKSQADASDKMDGRHHENLSALLHLALFFCSADFAQCADFVRGLSREECDALRSMDARVVDTAGSKLHVASTSKGDDDLDANALFEKIAAISASISSPPQKILGHEEEEATEADTPSFVQSDDCDFRDDVSIMTSCSDVSITSCSAFKDAGRRFFYNCNAHVAPAADALSEANSEASSRMRSILQRYAASPAEKLGDVDWGMDGCPCNSGPLNQVTEASREMATRYAMRDACPKAWESVDQDGSSTFQPVPSLAPSSVATNDILDAALMELTLPNTCDPRAKSKSNFTMNSDLSSIAERTNQSSPSNKSVSVATSGSCLPNLTACCTSTNSWSCKQTAATTDAGISNQVDAAKDDAMSRWHARREKKVEARQHGRTRYGAVLRSGHEQNIVMPTRRSSV